MTGINAGGRTSLGAGDITTDAWGIQLVSLPKSLVHGLWTFDVPASMWFMYENGTQVYTSTSIVSSGGIASMTADAAGNAVVLMESREAPRYQPDRGHRASMANFIDSTADDATYDFGLFTAENGVFFRWKSSTQKLYAVRLSGGIEVNEDEIITSGLSDFMIDKNTTFDIQFQWRSAGNYKFFIGNASTGAAKLVHTLKYLGTLRAASIENPAMPIAFRVTAHTGTANLKVGCADITSENGSDDKEQYGSTRTKKFSGAAADFPAIVVYNPLQIGATTNTRTISIARITINSSKKAGFEVWTTRDPTAFTGPVFKAIGDGSFVETDSTDNDATATRATAVTLAKLKYVTTVNAEANVRAQTDNPNPIKILFSLVRGDYLTITCDDGTATVDVVVEWGEAV